MNGPSLPALSARLARLQHMVPADIRATVTSVNGLPAIALHRKRTGELVALETAPLEYLRKLEGRMNNTTMRPTKLGGRAPQTRGSAWR